MDLSPPLVCLALLVVGLVLAGVSLWCRFGAGRSSRWWVREPLDGPRVSFAYSETLVLVVLSLLAQLALVGSLAIGVRLLGVLPDRVFSPVMGIVVYLEIALSMALLLATAYRDVLPLWLYPWWLRPLRAEERAALRRRR